MRDIANKRNLNHRHYCTLPVYFNDPFLPVGFTTSQIGEDAFIEGIRINIKNPDFHFTKLEFKQKSDLHNINLFRFILAKQGINLLFLFGLVFSPQSNYHKPVINHLPT